jgi:hypothetical protein
MTAVLFRYMKLAIWAIFRDFMITFGRVPKVRNGCSKDKSQGLFELIRVRNDQFSLNISTKWMMVIPVLKPIC